MKCRASCCNTEHTGPGQKLDNWGSPVERDRQCWEIAGVLHLYKDKERGEKKSEIKKR